MKWYVLLLPFVATGCDCGGDPGTGGDNQPPAVTILMPADGEELSRIGPYNLAGSATDPEDGTLSGNALMWSSSADGPLGTGDALSVPLSPGAHVLTLEATDSQGAVASAQVSVVVRGQNAAPVATITAPLASAMFTEGEPITLMGTGSDVEDGALSGTSLTWTSSLDGLVGTGTSLTWNAPSLGQHQILLTVVDSEGAEGLASVSITVVPLGSNLLPAVTIDTPADGANVLAGALVALSGSATDPEDGPLTGASLTWLSSIDGVLGTGASLDIDTLSQGLHIITLRATDSEGGTAEASVTITVNPANNQPPLVSISSPAHNSVHFAGAGIAFAASATDPEDGTIAGANITWSSTVDGVLGTGATLDVSSLTVATHRITASAVDSGGSIGVAFIDITVLAANEPPVATITGPPDNTISDAGTIIMFRGTATDPEDGALTGTALTWRSHVDGVIGYGQALDFASLSAGTHMITLSAVDSGGRTGTDSIQITINPATVNLPPVALLNAPMTAYVGDSVPLDASSSNDPDGSIDEYRFDFGDATPAQTRTTPGTTHIYTAPGTYTITLTVTDNNAATAQTTATIDIAEPVRVPVVVSNTIDALGTACDIDVDANDHPHVAYHNDTHPGIWYARHDGSAWTTEFVDGMGFDTGGQVQGNMSIAVDASNRPHLAYIIDINGNAQVYYAHKTATGWIRERVDTTLPFYSPQTNVAIALDPANGERPTIVYTSYVGAPIYNYGVTIAYRTGTNTWINEPGLDNDHYFAGGLAFDSSGVAHFAIRNYNTNSGDGSTSQYIRHGTWPPYSESAELQNSYSPDNARLALDATGQPIVMYRGGMAHRIGNAWIYSEIETTTLGYFDIAAFASAIWAVYRHSSDIEIATALSGGFWQRSYQGPMDSAQPGVAIDSAMEPRVCFFRNYNLLVY